MIDLYFAPTPNGHKITLFLEETQLDYRIIKVDISKGDQFGLIFWPFRPTIKFPRLSIPPCGWRQAAEPV